MEAVDNEKSKNLAIKTGDGRTGDSDTRRKWDKPVATRIEIKRTMFGAGSGNDGSTLHTN
ncbi:MAG TPA: hypothetical protein VF799_02840 [Geobacteraceae bacterium]